MNQGLKISVIDDAHLYTYPVNRNFQLQFYLAGTTLTIMQAYSLHFKAHPDQLEVSQPVALCYGYESTTLELVGREPGTSVLQIIINGHFNHELKLHFTSGLEVFYAEEIRGMRSLMIHVHSCSEGDSAAYEAMYCMHAADRALSELLGDKENFYGTSETSQDSLPVFVPDDEQQDSRIPSGYEVKPNPDCSHKAISNGVSFVDLSCIDRGLQILEMGHVESLVLLGHNEVFKDGKDGYLEPDLIFEVFSRSLKMTPGYHVYYVSIAAGWHTMTLIIDNTLPVSPIYEFWDQDGLRGSSGLEHIANGPVNQGYNGLSARLLRRVASGYSLECIFFKIRRKPKSGSAIQSYDLYTTSDKYTLSLTKIRSLFSGKKSRVLEKLQEKYPT